MSHRLSLRAALRFLPLPLALLAPAAARAQFGTTQLPPPSPNDPVERLSRYLRELSINPRSLDALTGAGHAALDVGDPSAAVGFFARAQEAAPRDGRVKAGLAAALVQLEQPRDALRLFDQARDLGAPEAEYAADRGLAYDLRGEGRRAQEDYRRALAAHPGDAEATRRLALSLAMSGDRAGALAVLDPLLRKQDRAAWRASTFVLAMTGDTAGADVRVGQLMVPAQAQAMRPFLDRLAKLAPAEQAAAVHFGHFPSNARGGRSGQLAAASPPRRASAADRARVPASAPFGIVAPAPATSPQPAPIAPVTPAATGPGFADAFAGARDPLSRASRRRPGQIDAAAVPQVRTASATPVAPVSAAPGFSGYPAASTAPGVSATPARTVPTGMRPAAMPARQPASHASEPLAGPASQPTASAAQVARIEPPRAAPAAVVGAGRPAVTSAPVEPTAVPPSLAPHVAQATAPIVVSHAPVASMPATLAPLASPGPLPPPDKRSTVPTTLPGLAVAERADTLRAARPEPGTTGPTGGATSSSVAPASAAAPGPVARPDAQLALADGGAAAAIRSFTLAPPAAVPVSSAGADAAPSSELAAPVATGSAPQAAQMSQASSPPVSPAVEAARSTSRAAASPAPAEGVAKPLAHTSAPRAAIDPGKARVPANAKPAAVESLSDSGLATPSSKPRHAGKPGAAAQSADEAGTSAAAAKHGTRGKLAAADVAEDAKPKLSPKEAKAKALADAKAAKDAKEAKAKAAADAKAEKAKEAEAKRQARLAPERYWVQVAGGANKADLPKAWRQAQEKHPELAGKTPHTTPLRFTNRLLVGPFKSADEAQAFVNKTGKSGWQTFTFTSPAGQKVEPIGAK